MGDTSLDACKKLSQLKGGSPDICSKSFSTQGFVEEESALSDLIHSDMHTQIKVTTNRVQIVTPIN